MITEPGIYSISEEDYHADPCAIPSLSASIAKVLLASSPLHARLLHPRLNSDHKPTEKRAFDLGSACHALLLEGIDKLEVIDADSWRTNAAKEARDDARKSGKIPMLSKDADQIREMHKAAVEAIATCEDLAGITLSQGKSEQTLMWREGDVWCRSRIDWLADDRSLVLDIKTTGKSASPTAVLRTLLSMGYDLQSAFYVRGIKALVENAMPKFVFMFQETEPPYAVSFIGMPPAWMELGADKFKAALRMWKTCTSKDYWPGYGKRIHWPELPPWALTQWNESNYEGIVQ